MTYPPQQPGPYGPQDPYGQQQPYGQQPQPPQYGAPQWGPPGYPVGPPPKKSKTGLITTLVIVAVLVVGGGGVAAFLLLRDDGGGGGGSAAGGGTAREAADAFTEELGTQLSKPVEEVDLGKLRPLTCGDDYKKLDEELDGALDDQSSASKSADPDKVSFAVSNFKESADGATFDMTPTVNGEKEDAMNMTVLKENENWVVCGLYEQGGQQEEPGSTPSNDGGGGGSIPNPIPKTS